MSTDTTTAPNWATQIGIGLYVAGLGAAVVAIGFFAVPALTGIGVAVVAVGAAIALIGGARYFMGIRR